MKNKYRFIISGGGTGGHIYPAIAVAEELKNQFPNADFLFVGAEGRMEMEKVPQANYNIVGLPVAGIQRRFTLKNLLFPFKLIRSLNRAKKIIKGFQPTVVIGFGGYASGPVLRVAQYYNVPTVIQEQNSYAGLTNKWLAKKAKKICVAYEGMQKYFPEDKIVLTGNPVRKDILDIKEKKDKACEYFALDKNKYTLLVIGGSLGARTINESVLKGLKQLQESGVQLLWQTGKFYYKNIIGETAEFVEDSTKIHQFIYEMDLAYAAADMVVSRAGALSISELCLVNKPTILVPSPNVSEDHQTSNAMALVDKKAAILVKDAEAKDELVKMVLTLMNDKSLQNELSKNITSMEKPEAVKNIVEEIKKELN